MATFQVALARLLASRGCTVAITVLIVVNGAIIGLETYPDTLARWGTVLGRRPEALLDALGQLIIALFVLELAGKLLVQRRDFLRDGWNLFDTAVVLVTLLTESGAFSVFRVLRVLRTMRLLSRFPTLKLISAVIAKSLTGCVSITFLMLLVLYVFAIIGNNLFGASHPALFGNLHVAMYTLFRVAACYSLEEVGGALATVHPHAYFFLVPYFILMSFGLINFFAAIIVYFLYEYSFEELRDGRVREGAEKAADGARDLERVLGELASLRAELRALRPAADPPG